MDSLTNTLTQELVQEAGPHEASGKLIIAHLGNGASMAAIEGWPEPGYHHGTDAGRGPGDEHAGRATWTPE